MSYLVANKAMRVWQRHWFKWQHCSGNRLAVEPLARSQAWTIRGNRLLAPRRRKGRIARASQPQPVAGAEPSYESAHHSHILLQALVQAVDPLLPVRVEQPGQRRSLPHRFPRGEVWVGLCITFHTPRGALRGCMCC